MIRRRAVWCLPGVPLGLAGCGASLLPKPAPIGSRYTLDDGIAPSTAPAPAASGAPVLVVDGLLSMPGYDSTRMLYQRHPQELEAYAYAQWVAPPAAMLAPRLVRALQRTGTFSAVLLAPSGTPEAWHLSCEFVSLRQTFGAGPSRVRLALRAVLLGGTPRRVLAWRDFAQEAASPTEDAAGGASAAGRAAGQLLQDVARWCTERLASSDAR